MPCQQAISCDPATVGGFQRAWLVAQARCRSPGGAVDCRTHKATGRFMLSTPSLGGQGLIDEGH